MLRTRQNNNIRQVNEPTQNVAYIRFLNAIVDSGDSMYLDIYSSDTLVARGLSMSNFTEYIPAIPGNYTFRVYDSAMPSTPILSFDTTLEPNIIYTIALTGRRNDFSMAIVEDTHRQKNPGVAYMRFASLIPDATGIDIYIDENLVVSNLGLETVTDYIDLVPGSHTLRVTRAGTNENIAYHPNMVLSGGNYYTTYAVGLLNGEPMAHILIPLEGTSYLIKK